jgi:MFS transporter, DHA1 family, multidrug resistance protein
MVHSLRLPRYFHAHLKKQMAELYASSAIADIAMAIVMLFEPIYLYNVLHFSVPEVLLFMGAVYALYVVLLPFGGKIVSRFGYEHGIFFSIPFQILYWILLFGSQQYIVLVFLAPIAFAIQKTLFWPSFHACVAKFANQGQQGREFSMLHQIINLSFVLGPYLGGLISERFGVRITFIIASLVYFSSFIPLLANKRMAIPRRYDFKDTIEIYRRSPKKFLGYVGFGEELLVLTVWPIFIFLVVKNYEDTGILATLAAFVAMVVGLYIGKMTDKAKSKVAVLRFGTVLYFLTWLGRISANTFFSVFTVDSLSRVSKELVFIPLSTVTYERAESTKIMPYIIFFEQSLAIGKVLAVLLGFIVFAATGSFMAVFLLAGLFSLLYMLI